MDSRLRGNDANGEHLPHHKRHPRAGGGPGHLSARDRPLRGALIDACTPCPSRRHCTMHLRIETEREDDGRWIAEVAQLPGVLAYGATAEEASAKAEILALRVLAERLEHGEAKPVEISISLATT